MLMLSRKHRIENLIKGSSIEYLFIEVYAENTVNHIMSGKVVSRALRTHFLTEAIFITPLLEQVFNNDMIDMIETKCFNKQLTEAVQNKYIINKEAFLEKKVMQICQ